MGRTQEASMEPILSDIFPGATQTLSAVVIPKSALNGVGMSIEASNRGDQISVALLILMAGYYNEVRRTADPAVSIVATMGTPSIEINFTNETNYLNRPIEFSLFSELELPDLNPDSY